MTGQDGSSILQPGNRNYAPEYSAHTRHFSARAMWRKGAASQNGADLTGPKWPRLQRRSSKRNERHARSIKGTLASKVV